jgi:hypothetical protein
LETASQGTAGDHCPAPSQLIDPMIRLRWWSVRFFNELGDVGESAISIAERLVVDQVRRNASPTHQ